MSRVDAAAKRFEPLNDLPEAARYLALFDRDVEVRVGDESVCLSITKGRIHVGPGPAAQADRSVLITDPQTWDSIVAGRQGFSDAGGGIGGRLRCVAGSGSWDDMSWVGILTRLAQETR